jgi:hypothetical protein
VYHGTRVEVCFAEGAARNLRLCSKEANFDLFDFHRPSIMCELVRGLDCERPGVALPNRQRLLGGNGRRPVSVAELPVSLAILCKSGKVSRFGNAVPGGIDLNLAP